MKKKWTISRKIIVCIVAILSIAVVGAVISLALKYNNEIKSSQEHAVEHIGVQNETVKLGTVVTKYVDTEGNQLENPETQQGEIGTQYTTTRKNIDNYISAGSEPLNKIGDYSDEEIEVTYVYKRVSDSVDIVNDGDVITVKVENTLKNREYALRLEQESKDGYKLTGGEFSLIDVENNHSKVEGTTRNGKLTLGVISVCDEVNDELFLDETKVPTGYEKALEEGGAKVSLYKSYNDDLKKYELRAVSESLELELEQNDETNEIILKVKNDMVKTYDLAIKQFASSINGEETGRNITASVNEDGEIEYSEIKKDLQVRNGEKIIYTIRVYNEGNQDMGGQTITYSLPKGLKFLENSQVNKDNEWNLSEGELKTNIIKKEIIEGINTSIDTKVDYKEIQLELEIEDNKEIEGDALISTASIPLSEHEENQDNNSCTETVNLSKVDMVNDLSMKKFLYSVDEDILKDREIVAKNTNGEITYTKNNEIYKVSNNQKLVYTLRVYNLGEGETTGRRIIENIPDGLQLVKDSKINQENGWKMYKQDENGALEEVNDIASATVVITDKLENETIAGFRAQDGELPEYKDIYIELIVVEDKIKSEDRILTNTAKIDESRLEPDQTNDNDTEQVYVKEFDLNLTKYIKEIRIQDDTGTKTINVGLENKGKIVKVEIDKKKVNQTTVYVTYGLKVKNIGEIEGYATELTDYVPEDLVLESSDGVWTADKNTLTTNTLQDKLIEPGESKTIEVTFKWKLNENNLGARTNAAITSAYKNIYEAKDKTPDKDNSETFIISLRTGIDFISTILGVITMILICACIALSIKLKKSRK